MLEKLKSERKRRTTISEQVLIRPLMNATKICEKEFSDGEKCKIFCFMPHFRCSNLKVEAASQIERIDIKLDLWKLEI